MLTRKTYHHIEERATYFTRLQTELKPGCRMVHVDHRDHMNGILSLFQTTDHCTNVEATRTAVDSASYRRVAGHNF